MNNKPTKNRLEYKPIEMANIPSEKVYEGRVARMMNYEL
jgi:hypothetical protein